MRMKKTVNIQMNLDVPVCWETEETIETIRNVVEGETSLRFVDIGLNYRRELEDEITAYFLEYITQHPETRDKPYVYRNQQVWTPQDIYNKLVTDKLFYKQFEKDLLMLAIDLILRNKENIQSFTIRAVT